MTETPKVRALIEQCQRGDRLARIRAMTVLQEMDAREAVPAILPLLASDHEGVRNAATDALGALGRDCTDQVGPALEVALDDSEDLVRSGAAAALGRLRYTPARSSLEHALLRDDDWVVRASAAEALGDLGDIQALDALALALTDEVEPVRGYAALSIGLLGSEAQLPLIRSRLSVEEDAGTRGELLAAALRLGDEAAFEQLLVLVSDVDEDAAITLHNAIEDLLSRRTPELVAVRAPELKRCLDEAAEARRDRT